MTQYIERPLYFDSGRETLFGVLTEPADQPSRVNLLAVCPGSWIPSWHRGRMWVRLAHTLVDDGVRTLRFDYHGVGESTGRSEFSLEWPHVQDADSAYRVLMEGQRRHPYLVGTCFGARTAAAFAASKGGTAGLVFLALPVRDERSNSELVRRVSPRRLAGKLADRNHRRRYAKVLRSRFRNLGLLFRSRVSRSARQPHNFADDLAGIIRRGIPCLLVYGTADNEYRWFQQAVENGKLGEVLRSGGDLVEVKLVEGRFHGFASEQSQTTAIEIVREWIASRDEASSQTR